MLLDKELRLPLIKIKDCGREKIIGSNHHHNLLIEDEKLMYFNSQDCSTVCKDDGINFVSAGYNDFVDRDYISFIALEEALLIESEMFDEEYNQEIKEVISRYKDIKEKAQERENKALEEFIKKLGENKDDR